MGFFLSVHVFRVQSLVMLGFWWSENFKYTAKAVIRFLKLARSIFSHNVLYLRYSTRKGYNIAATTPSVEK